MPDGASRNPKRGRIKSLAVNLAVVQSEPVDRSAGFGFLMVPDMGLEPVRMVSPTVLRRSKEKDSKGQGWIETILMLSVNAPL